MLLFHARSITHSLAYIHICASACYRPDRLEEFAGFNLEMLEGGKAAMQAMKEDPKAAGQQVRTYSCGSSLTNVDLMALCVCVCVCVCVCACRTHRLRSIS